MAVKVSIQTVEASGDAVFVSGKLIPSGNYTTGGINGGSGGDTVDFTPGAVQIDAKASGACNIGIVPSGQPPSSFSAWSQAGVLGYQYCTQIGTAMNNNKFVVSALNSFGTELGTGAYPAVILADNIGFNATFQKLG